MSGLINKVKSAMHKDGGEHDQTSTGKSPIPLLSFPAIQGGHTVLVVSIQLDSSFKQSGLEAFFMSHVL